MNYATDELVLENYLDGARVLDGEINEEDVRSMKAEVLVDKKIDYLVINENIKEKLGLIIKSKRQVKFADGRIISAVVTSTVRIRWKDRYSACEALVLPGQSRPIIGRFPIEEMDLMVDPETNKLVGAHGDDMQILIMSADESCIRGQGECVGECA